MLFRKILPLDLKTLSMSSPGARKLHSLHVVIISSNKKCEIFDSRAYNYPQSIFNDSLQNSSALYRMQVSHCLHALIGLPNKSP